MPIGSFWPVCDFPNSALREHDSKIKNEVRRPQKSIKTRKQRSPASPNQNRPKERAHDKNQTGNHPVLHPATLAKPSDSRTSKPKQAEPMRQETPAARKAAK